MVHASPVVRSNGWWHVASIESVLESFTTIRLPEKCHSFLHDWCPRFTAGFTSRFTAGLTPRFTAGFILRSLLGSLLACSWIPAVCPAAKANCDRVRLSYGTDIGPTFTWEYNV